MNNDQLKEINDHLKEVIAKERVRLIGQYSPQYVHFLQHVNLVKGEYSLKRQGLSDTWSIQVEYQGNQYKCEPDISMNLEKTKLERMCTVEPFHFTVEERKHLLEFLRQNGAFKIFNV